MNRETRRMRGSEIRATTDNGIHYLTLQPIVPGVVDDYGSVWTPDCFDDSLAERMPTLAWAHSWSDPIGRAVDYTTNPTDGPTVRFRLDNFDDVPRARQAWSQVNSGTIDDCSVGFSCDSEGRRPPTDAEIMQWPGAREIIFQAGLDETSLVLRGAVPGAKVLATRSAGGTGEVDAEFVIDLARRVSSGEISEAEAKVAIDLAATHAPAPDPVIPAPATDDLVALEAEAGAALDQLTAPRSR